MAAVRKAGSSAEEPPAAPNAGLPSVGMTGLSVAVEVAEKSLASAFALPDVSP